MADVEHETIQSEDCHEPKHITNATIGDAGKVITPSGSTSGASVLRRLTLEDLGGSQFAAMALTGSYTHNHSPGNRLDLNLMSSGSYSVAVEKNINSPGSSVIVPFEGIYTVTGGISGSKATGHIELNGSTFSPAVSLVQLNSGDIFKLILDKTDARDAIANFSLILKKED